MKKLKSLWTLLKAKHYAVLEGSSEDEISWAIESLRTADNSDKHSAIVIKGEPYQVDTKGGIIKGVKEPRMNVKPINDALLVELIESESGVAIATDDAHKSITRGKVIAVSDNPLWVQGNGYSIQNDGTGFKELMARIDGKIIYFRRYADQDCGMSQAGVKYALIRLADVMGVVE